MDIIAGWLKTVFILYIRRAAFMGLGRSPTFYFWSEVIHL